jgi:Protein of unknown function (DUF4019)
MRKLMLRLSALCLAAMVSIGVVPTGLVGQSTVDTTAVVEAARIATAAWLELVDSGKYAESWNEAATSFQQAVTQSAWENSVRQARAPFEPFGTRREIMARYTTELPNAPPGRYVLVQYQTSVAGDRQVVETIVPIWDGDRGWRVSGYFVRPM